MNKPFVWNPNENQLFDGSFGSQTVECSGPDSFAKFETNFIANAPGGTLTLKQIANTDKAVVWNRNPKSDDAIINVIDTRLTIDLNSMAFMIKSSDNVEDFDNYKDIETNNSNLTFVGEQELIFSRDVISANNSLIGTTSAHSIYIKNSKNNAQLSADNGKIFLKCVSECSVDRVVTTGKSDVDLRAAFVEINDHVNIKGGIFKVTGDRMIFRSDSPFTNHFDGTSNTIITVSSIHLNGSTNNLYNSAKLSIGKIDIDPNLEEPPFVFNFDSAHGVNTATLELSPISQEQWYAMMRYGYITVDGNHVLSNQFPTLFTVKIDQQSLTIQRKV